MKPRINLMIWNIRKKKIFNHNRKEKKDYQNKQTKKQIKQPPKTPNQSEQEEENRIQKKPQKPQTEETVSSLWDNFKKSNIHFLGVSEREEKEQEIGNLFEKIMKENFPNLVKKIDMLVRKHR